MGTPLEILSAMLGGGAPQGVPADVPVPTSRMDALGENGGEVQNPNAVGAPVAKSPLGNVLARLKTAQSPMAGLGQLKLSPGANKSAAFFEGMSSGMKNANDSASAQAKADSEAEDKAFKRKQALVDAHLKLLGFNENQRRNTILESYYKGLIANGAAGKGGRTEKAEKPVDPAMRDVRINRAINLDPEVKDFEAKIKRESGRFNGGDPKVIADLETQRAAKVAELRKKYVSAAPDSDPAPAPATPAPAEPAPQRASPARRVGMEPATPPAQAPAEPATPQPDVVPLPPERPAPAAAAPKNPVLDAYPDARQGKDGKFYVKTEGGWAPVITDEAPPPAAAPAEGGGWVPPAMNSPFSNPGTF